jgi:hypothetical protein
MKIRNKEGTVLLDDETGRLLAEPGFVVVSTFNYDSAVNWRSFTKHDDVCVNPQGRVSNHGAVLRGTYVVEAPGPLKPMYLAVPTARFDVSAE